ncbi:MAG TPA: tetratricopeptide repeat protein [Pyrinomonadaceae bacterium]
MTPQRFKGGGSGAGKSRAPFPGLATALLLCAVASGAGGQQKELPRMPQPARVFTIQGQVTLPEGVPAGHTLVTLVSRAGVPRQTFTTEHGRFEFEGIPEGEYSLSAKSLTDPGLTADRVETDTSRTATGNLYVNLNLRKEVASSGAPKKAEAVSVVEVEQKVPKRARQAFREALKLREGRRNDEAVRSLTRAVELFPDYFQALAERGDLLIVAGRLSEAAEDFARALKVNPRYGPALRGAGYCKLERREFEEAAGHLEQATTAQPTDANAYLLLGIAYLELDRRGQAEGALLKALSFDTRRELRAHIHLGNLYAREGRHGEAAEQLRKYLEANPADPDAARLREVEARWRARAAAP